MIHTKNVADYIAEFCFQIGIINMHGLMGGGASGLNDGVIKHGELKYLCYHHEQAAGYAALGEARLTRSWAVLNPTTGCGGTNCYTPVLNAWQDSVPLVVISGNVNSDTCANYLNKRYSLNLRCYGVQENDIEKTAKEITKYSCTLHEISDLEQVFSNAFIVAMQDRRGPVWIDIPADIQHKELPTQVYKNIPNIVKAIKSTLESGQAKITTSDLHNKLNEANQYLRNAERPLILLGGGARSKKDTANYVREFVLNCEIPVVTTYAATDIIPHSYDHYLGCIGVKGNRAANFSVQNCDVLLVLGSRLPFAVTGYDRQAFAMNAKIVVIDVDTNEICKNELMFPKRMIQVNVDIEAVLKNDILEKCNVNPKWQRSCSDTKRAWDTIKENKFFFNYSGISIYHVMEEFQKTKYDNSNFVLDAGSISYVGPTTLTYTLGRNFVFSPAQADMGCALPSALGAASASKSKSTYCITGDGSFMSNLQELATLKQEGYDLKIILLNNHGYLSITNTQRNNYGNRIYGEHKGRGLYFPDYKDLCIAFDIPYMRIDHAADIHKIGDQHGPILFDVRCLVNETIAPYQARIGDKQAGMHDMAPHYTVDELKSFQSIDLPYMREV